MSVLRSLNTGASGIKAHGDALGVIGDNIANVNTAGFKRSRAQFEDILGRSISSAENAPPMAGAGVRMASIEQLWSQGALLTTESPTDLAMSGDGFFVVEGNVSGTTGRYYTRAGQFHVDASGQIVNPNGMKLQGYGVDTNGNLQGTVGDLIVEPGTIAANATTAVDLAINLDANAAEPAAWDVTDPAGTSNFSTGVTVYDSLGNSHEVTVYFRKTATSNEWEWHALVDGGELTGGTAGTPTEGASGTLLFTTNGALDSETPGASSWGFLNATAAQAIAFDFGTSITGDSGTGLDASTQFGSPFTTNGISQDGYGAGSVAGIAIGSDGTVTGVFTNGQRRTLGQVAVADFASVEGLERAGDTLWTETGASGEALIGMAEAGGRGSIVAGALEQSNIDLGREFVDLIAYQRGFQANSKIITTSDQLYQELIALKR